MSDVWLSLISPALMLGTSDTRREENSNQCPVSITAARMLRTRSKKQGINWISLPTLYQQTRTMTIVILLLMMMIVGGDSRCQAPSSCYYQPFYKQLTCSCSGDVSQGDQEEFINIKLEYFIRELGQEVQFNWSTSKERGTLRGIRVE